MTLPKPMTSGIEAKGRFGKQDFAYLSEEDAYRCPAGEKLKYHYTNEEDGQKLRRYWTNALMKRLPKVATEMALHVLAYNLTRVMNIMGTQLLMAARCCPYSLKNLSPNSSVATGAGHIR